jgi:low temperature requirement protein LtrA
MAATLISGLVFLGLHTFTAYSERQAAVRLGVAGATIALEIIVTLIAAPLPSLAPKNLHLLLERYGLLTLYILGEGLIGLCVSHFIAHHSA